MAKATVKSRSYLVTARVVVETGVPVVADSLIEAVQKAQALTVTDCVEIPGEHLDSAIKIIGVYDASIPGCDLA